jgi:hypothetical protein
MPLRNVGSYLPYGIPHRNPDWYIQSGITKVEVNWAAICVFTDEPTVQGVRGASGRLPFWRLHVRGMQGETALPTEDRGLTGGLRLRGTVRICNKKREEQTENVLLTTL